MSDDAKMDIDTDRIDVIACRKCGHHIAISDRPPFSDVTCPECGTAQKVPVRLGAFLLLEMMGKGGMGAVYKALDQTLGRYVAVKVMRRELGNNTQFLENFLREARAAAALNHRNVVQIYSCGQEKGQPYIVMELVGGGRLDTLMASGTPLDEVRVLEVGTDVAEGLRAAHEIGLVHGDIKPANVLFGRDGAAKVVDFGLARFVAAQQGTPGEVWGTPFYIAPEKVQKLPEDHRSDIYSLGATLFHAFSGRPPFDGETATDVVLARLKQPPPNLREIRVSVHPETAGVIARMLEADPARRYPTYKSLLADMQEALHAARATPAGGDAATRRRKRVVLVTLAAVLVLGGAMVYGGLKWSAYRKAQREEAEKHRPKKWVLRDGELVPVYETAEEPAAPPGSAATEESQEPVASEALVQPFSTEDAEALVRAFQDLAAGQPEKAGEALQALHDRRAGNPTATSWVRLFQAVAIRSGGRTEPYNEQLRALRNVSFPEKEGRTHPGTLVRNLARFLLDDIDAAKLWAGVEDRPEGYEDLVVFFEGFKALQEGRLDVAVERFDVYGKTGEGREVRWPYALQSVAAAWREQTQEWQTLSSSVKQVVADDGTAQALKQLNAFRERAAPLLHGLVDGRIADVQETASARVEQERKQAEEEKRRAEETARRQGVQQDLDRLDQARETMASLVAARDFAKASSQVARLRGDLETTEGRELLKILSDGYRRMEELKQFLVDRVQDKPFGDAAQRELGGAAIGANRMGIRVSLGVHGETLKPWDQISSRLLVWMASHYLSDPAIPEEERANHFFGLALFCYEGGAFGPASQYAGTAVEMNAGLLPEVRKHMPDILKE